MKEFPTDRDLVRLYWPAHLRPAFEALFAIDESMAEVVTSASQPALAAIKLAWWRDALEGLDSAPPPAEPRLQAAAAELLPRGIAGAELARIEAGWAAALGDPPDAAALGERGVTLFRIGARLLDADGDADGIDAAGRLFAAVDAARRGIVGVAGVEPVAWRAPQEVRPLTALAALAARDLRRGPPAEPEATPGRALALIAHRLTGRLS